MYLLSGTSSKRFIHPIIAQTPKMGMEHGSSKGICSFLLHTLFILFKPYSVFTLLVHDVTFFPFSPFPFVLPQPWSWT
jgi:hypothetical protein